jgi:hypothetical protein
MQAHVGQDALNCSWWLIERTRLRLRQSLDQFTTRDLYCRDERSEDRRRKDHGYRSVLS